MHTRLVIKGLDSSHPGTMTSLSIPIGDALTFPVLEGRRTRDRVADSERIYTLRIHELDSSAEPEFPNDVVLALKNKTARIEDLLELGTEAFIRFAVTVNHARSGYSRTFVKKFRLNEIRTGKFREDSIDIS
jgi:hypothetical protein